MQLMGSHKSGRFGRRGRGTTCEAWPLRIRELQGWLAASPSAETFVTWRAEARGLQAHLRSLSDGVAVASRNLTRAQQIAIEWAPCNFGGRRGFFCCPADGCGARSSTLYVPWAGKQIFQCRRCHGLLYPSQLQTKHERLVTTLERIEERLGVTRLIIDDPPPRPRGMRRVTFQALLARWAEIEVRRQEESFEELLRYMKVTRGNPPWLQPQ